MATGRDASAPRRGWLAAVSALGLAVLALSVWAAPSGAVVAKVGRHAYGLTPIRGLNPTALPSVQRALKASSRSATGPLPYDSLGNLSYHSGPVMHSVTTHVVYWDPSGEFTTTTKSITNKFFTDVAHDSSLATNVFGVAGQYGDSTGHALYSSTFGSEGTDANEYPENGCTVPNEGDLGPPYTHCITDEQLQEELSAYVAAHSLATGPAQQYFVLLPHKVVTCFTETTECSNNVFCAYHGSIATGTANEIIYSDIPFSLLDTGFAKDCQFDQNTEVQHPNGDTAGTDESTRYADVALKYTSHEYIEASTDPLLDAWWETAHGQEIGDKCNFAGSGTGLGEDPNAFKPTLGGSAVAGTLYDQLINSDHFYIQSEWDNAGNACLMKPTALSGASFTASPSLGVVGSPVKFSGAVTDPYGGPSFTWKFGDGTESTGAAPEHTYSAGGSYEVTMTPKDEFTDSTSAPVVHTFVVGDEQPTAAFAVEPNPAEEGKAVKFKPTGSTDPDGTITGYAWKFGDGTADSTAEAPEHTYAASGSYTVTLTVTDSSSQKGTTTHTVTVDAVLAVVTGAASALGPTSATLNATVNPHGANVTECKFEYGPTSLYGSSAPCASLPGSGNSPVGVSAAVTGLSVKTPYHFRIVAKNSFGEHEGLDETFTTTSDPPTSVTESASSVTQTAATLNATVNPNGGNVTECRFEYGTTSVYTASTSCASLPGAGTSPVPVSSALGSLTASTTYHFRIAARNGSGAGHGADQTFTTAANPVVEIFTPFVPLPTVTSPVPNSAFSGPAATFNAKTAAITFKVSVSNAGTLSWLLTFQNGKFGVFAASTSKCKTGYLKLNGRCRPAKVAYAKGSTALLAAGAATFTVKPARSALTALRNALKRKKALAVTITLTFQSSLGGAPVSHSQSATIKLRK